MPLQSSYVDGDREIIQMMDHYYNEAYPINSALWREGQIDKRFKVGDQNLLSLIYGDSAFFNRRRFFFNLIRRHVNMIAGYQRQHRKSTQFIPTEDRDQQMADDYTKLTMWSERREGYHEYESQAFEGALDVGDGWLNLYVDYTTDPVSGDLCTDYVSYNNIMTDPYWRKQDLSDCNFIWRRRWVSKKVAKNLLPGRAEEIEGMRPNGSKDGRFPIQAEALNNTNQDLFTYDEFYYLDDREIDIVVDTKTGETVEWEENPDDQDDELEMTLSQQPWLAVKKGRKPTVKLAIVLGNKVMYNGPNLLNVDRYPFVPVLCYHEPDIQNYAWRIQGIVRNLRDAQYLYNRRKIIELDILESQINSGYKYKVGAVTDEAAFRQSGQGFLIPVNETHEMTDVERIDPPGIPPSMMELSRSLAEDITKISGVNEELLGMAEDDKAGILAMVRQGASLTTLQTIFDKLDYSKKLYAQLRLEAIRKNWSNGKIRSILGKDPAPNFRLTNTQKFDVVVEEGTLSATQQQLAARQLLYLVEMGAPIGWDVIIQQLPLQDKDKILQSMQAASQQQQQQQEAMAQQQQEQNDRQRMLDFAKAQKDMAGARDLQANAAEKTVRMNEIEASAEQKATEADLNIVRQLIELENMTVSQISQGLQLSSALSEQRSRMIDVIPGGYNEEI